MAQNDNRPPNALHQLARQMEEASAEAERDARETRRAWAQLMLMVAMIIASVVLSIFDPNLAISLPLFMIAGFIATIMIQRS